MAELKLIVHPRPGGWGWLARDGVEVMAKARGIFDDSDAAAIAAERFKDAVATAEIEIRNDPFDG